MGNQYFWVLKYHRVQDKTDKATKPSEEIFRFYIKIITSSAYLHITYIAKHGFLLNLKAGLPPKWTAASLSQQYFSNPFHVKKKKVYHEGALRFTRKGLC